MNQIFVRTAAVAVVLLLAGCGNKGSSGPAAVNVRVTAGDNVATLTWDQDPSVDYMIFYAAAPSIAPDNWSTLPGAHALLQAGSPKVVTGLLNGTQYSFTINSSKNGGPGGAGSPSISATPRLAGASWRVGTPLGSSDLHGVASSFVNSVNLFITVGANGAMYTSADGFTWTPLNFVVTSTLNAVAYSGNYVAVGAGGVVLFSTDAATWTQKTSGTTNDLYAIATNGAGRYVAVGAKGTIVTSGDGQNWSLTVAGSNNLYGVAFGSGIYVAVGANGTLLTSADGVNWLTVSSQTMADLRGVAFGNVPGPPTGTIIPPSTSTPTYVAVGANGTLITSPDTATWTARAPIAANTLVALTYSTQFIGVGSGGGIYTSADGFAWQTATSGTTANLLGIGPGNHGYIAVGAAGTNLAAY